MVLKSRADGAGVTIFAAALFVPEISIWFAWMVAGSVGTGDYRAVTFFVGHGGYCMDKTLSCYKKMH